MGLDRLIVELIAQFVNQLLIALFGDGGFLAADSLQSLISGIFGG